MENCKKDKKENKKNIVGKEELMKKVKNKVSIIIIVLLGLVICSSLFTMNLKDYNEFRIHIDRIVAVKEAIKEKVFPPFISYKNMLGFGYALNIFYGVITTYIPLLISLITKSSIMAIKIYTLLTIILSGIMMYIFVNKITKSKIVSLISALIYMSCPYKICNIYSRNALGEYTAFIFLPMIFQGIYEIINDKDKNGKYYLIIGASLLVLSHTITTVYAILFVILYLLINYKKLKSKFIWKELGISAIIILILTLFYTIPILEHKFSGNYVIFDEDYMYTDGIDVYENTNSILDYFKLETNTGLNFSFGLVLTFLLIMMPVCYKKVDKKYKSTYTDFLMLAIIALFMTTKGFPWLIMPKMLTIIQFAWRLHGFFIFFISFIAGVNSFIIYRSFKKNGNIFLIILLLMIFILTALSVSKYQTISTYNYNMDVQFEKNIENATKLGPYNINRDYLPINVITNMDYMKNRENKTYILNGTVNIKDEKKYRLNDEMTIENANNATLELPYLYYHGYTVTLNDKKIKNYESANGFLCVNINENGILKVEYKGTNIEKTAMLISFIGLIIFITIGLVKPKNEMKIKYESK